MSQAIIDEANAAAQKAVDALITQHGPDHGAWMYCGFAWVTVRPARGTFISFCKLNRIGDTGVYGGYTLRPSVQFVKGTMGQSMELKEAACRAYADVLKAHGINATVGSRAD